MAEVIQKKSVKHDPAPSKVAAKTSCFLGCFRFSKGVSNKKPTTTTRSSSKSSTLTLPSKNEDHKIKDIKSTSGTTPRRRWFLILWSSWRFRNSMKSATKTVPIDTSGTVGDKRERPLMVKYSFIKTTKSKSKSKSGVLVSNSEREIPATADGERRGGTSQIEAEAELPPVSDVEQSQLTPLTQKPPDANTVNLENRGHLEAAKDNTCHNKRVSFCRNIDSLRSITGGGGGGGGASSSRSQPGSPVQEDTKSKAVTRTAPAVMSQSAPFPKRHSRRTETPASAQNKHYSSDKAAAGNNSKGETSIARTIISNKKLDPLVGMSIIMVTLIIMLLWGRLCAILCTSAWFYFLPRLKSPPTTHHSNPNSNSSINNPSDLDLNSEEYKKKVVLEGFLERNHRNIL